ncbi:MAG TPA: M28 family peptidase, partial [Firmicutes bacterium]|nr:M28 family peptidase [Bacillota bacterium]
TDRYGNIIVRRPARGHSAPRIGFMAHMDHPGCEVVEHRAGRVIAAWHGGVHQEYFVGARIRFYAADGEYTGVVEETTIDPDTHRVGTITVACDRTPPVGALGMWDVEPVEFANGVIRARAIDDLAGCGVMLCVLHELGDQPLDVDVWAVFTRAEEVGFLGAIGLARSGRLPTSLPVVSIEMSKSIPGGSQGMGPVVRLGDKSSVFDNGFLLYLRDIAAELKDERENFKYQQILMDGGSCEATPLSAFGFRTAGLAIPLQNYHNMKPTGPSGPWSIEPEEINFSDVLAGIDLCVAMCERFPGLQAVTERHRRKLLDTTSDRIKRLEDDIKK